jgi:hypothetical protein
MTETTAVITKTRRDSEPEYPNWNIKKVAPHLKPQKFNSTSSLYINSTITKPKNAELMHCIATCVVKTIEQNISDGKVVGTIFEAFDEAKHPLTSKVVDVKSVPSIETVEKLIKNVFKIGQLAPESLIMGVAYMNRITSSTTLKLTPATWKRLVLATLIMASKVWEDQAVWNVDFLDLFPLATPSDLGLLEKQVLTLLGFDVTIKASEFAKIYFDLRSYNSQQCEEEEQFLELKPLDKDGERELELRTTNYTEKHTKKLFRSSGSVDDIGSHMKSPRAILN